MHKDTKKPSKPFGSKPFGVLAALKKKLDGQPPSEEGEPVADVEGAAEAKKRGR